MRRFAITGTVWALVCLAAAGCGSHDLRASQPKTRVNGDGVAAVSDIARGTPRWLITQARLMAMSLHDPHPQRVRIRLGRVDTIEIWGRFRCDLCSRPAGAPPPRGTHASVRLNSRTHRTIVFGLTPH